ncbi:MAG: glycoside hydrolase family 57 protein, partial [Candidatus Omnitrophica bacterium]|nr:glycoside hydrolase family 57 protein [Candidatus Omnitrophota bacterium]
MLYLAFIFHMHQPYYKDLLTQETDSPWVRLHGTKDYLDMVQILEKYPAIHQTFNVVPSLIEQIEDYNRGSVKDKFLELSYKNASELTGTEKKFILDKFFSIDVKNCIAVHPRYYELYFKKQEGSDFSPQDYLDLQLWFNLAWIDPSFRSGVPELKNIVNKGRFFSEEEKRIVLDKQLLILKETIPGYRKMADSGQIEITVSPYYHPILPLLYDIKLGKEANLRTVLPHAAFKYPADAREQIEMAVEFYKKLFGAAPCGMWPSEESVCEHILDFFIQAGLNWIVADEAILFKSLKLKKRNTGLLYQPHTLKRKNGSLNIVFRDRNLSDLIGFVYHKWEAKDAVAHFLKHLENIDHAFGHKDTLVTIAMDGENAWEYYSNDGHDFLNELYTRICEAKFLKAVTVKESLELFPAQRNIPRLAAGSWIYGEFGKWIGSPSKNRAWEYLAQARAELQKLMDAG